MRISIAIAILIGFVQVGLAATDKDVQVVKRRIFTALTRESGRDPSSTARRHMNALREDGSWADVDYADADRANWGPAAHTARLLVMARAYRWPGGALAESGELRSRILRAFDYWIRRDLRCPNWWYNEIGVPTQVGDMMILMESELSPQQKSAGIAILKRANWARWTGQNLVWGTSIQIVRGCLENDPGVVAMAYDRMYQEIRIAKLGEEGIQADFSFHQHGPLLYCGGYGLGFTVDCARFVEMAKETGFQASEEKLRLLKAYVLDGQQWMTWKGLLDYEVTGRELTRPGKSAAALAPAVGKLAGLGGARAEELGNFERVLRGEANGRPITGNRHFWRSDYMSHRRNNWFASVRMYSDRLLNTDGFINGENKKSHHLADGANLIYVNGEEYRDIFPVWDWLRIPGTTIEQNTPLVPARVAHKGTASFVGGVSDGMYGVAAMHLKSGPLEARKAWFCFDEGIVCLGAGITCPGDNPVYTSINQCWLRGPVRVSTDAAPLPRGERVIPRLAWAWHDSVGYIFPGGAQVHVANRPQAGAWSEIGVGSARTITKDVFSLWIDHGKNANGGSYQYIVAPGVDEKQTARLAGDCPVEVLSNTEKLQAVWHKKAGIVGVVFSEPGKLGGARAISADRACLVLAKTVGKTTQIAVSNPEGRQMVVNVELDGSRVRFELPGGVDGGKSVVKMIEAR